MPKAKPWTQPAWTSRALICSHTSLALYIFFLRYFNLWSLNQNYENLKRPTRRETAPYPQPHRSGLKAAGTSSIENTAVDICLFFHRILDLGKRESHFYWSWKLATPVNFGQQLRWPVLRALGKLGTLFSHQLFMLFFEDLRYLSSESVAIRSIFLTKTNTKTRKLVNFFSCQLFTHFGRLEVSFKDLWWHGKLQLTFICLFTILNLGKRAQKQQAP